MLRWRLIGTIAILVPVLGLFWMDDQRNFGHPGIWYAILAFLIGVVCVVELSQLVSCLLYTSPSPRDATLSRMPSSA